jgi:hypothetical protein
MLTFLVVKENTPAFVNYTLLPIFKKPFSMYNTIGYAQQDYSLL